MFVPLAIITLSGNKIIGVVEALVIDCLMLITLTTVVFHYVSFFVGVPFLLVSLISSVDYRCTDFKQFAINMAYDLHEKGSLNTLELENIIDDIENEVLAEEEE